MLSGMARAVARRIVAVRGDRPFHSIDEFAARTGLSRAVLVRLTKAGIFGSLGLNRRSALWHALEQDQAEMPLFGGEFVVSPLGGSPSQFRLKAGLRTSFLPAMSPLEEVLADYHTAGLSLQAHPVQFLRAGLEQLGAVPAAGLKTWPDGREVAVAGIVLVRQRPGTAKGITFVTLEDETGTANLIIRPAVWKRYRSAALGATLLLARGRLQRQGLVIHVLTTRLEDLSGRLQEMLPQSRDFC
jgi:error-prone DNA polymerase